MSCEAPLWPKAAVGGIIKQSARKMFFAEHMVVL